MRYSIEKLGYNFNINTEVQETEEKHGNPNVETAVVQVEIRTEHFMKWSLDVYRYVSLPIRPYSIVAQLTILLQLNR
jgi:hypothetical protein